MEKSQKSSQESSQKSSQENSQESSQERFEIRCISEELIELAKKVNQEAVAEVDEEVLAGFRRDQVELLGGDEDFYDMVDTSLKGLKVVKEIKDAQQKLYGWRENFFHGNFRARTWVTWGGDDAHGIDTIPYQIACNFDNVMKLASTKRVLAPNECFYFMHDEIISSQATKCFDGFFRKMLEKDGELDSDEDEALDSEDGSLDEAEDDEREWLDNNKKA